MTNRREENHNFQYKVYLYPHKSNIMTTRKGFLRKNIVAVSFFSKLCCTPIFRIHILISSMNIIKKVKKSKNVLRMQGGHKPFSYVAVSFSPEHYLMCSQFCLIWTLLL